MQNATNWIYYCTNTVRFLFWKVNTMMGLYNHSLIIYSDDESTTDQIWTGFLIARECSGMEMENRLTRNSHIVIIISIDT